MKLFPSRERLIERDRERLSRDREIERGEKLELEAEADRHYGERGQGYTIRQTKIARPDGMRGRKV